MIKDVFRAFLYQGPQDNKAIEKWVLIESSSLSIISIALILLFIGYLKGYLYYVSAFIGGLTAIAIFFSYVFSTPKYKTAQLAAVVTTVVLSLATVATLSDQPLSIIFVNGFGGLLLILGIIGFFTNKFRETHLKGPGSN